MSSVASKQALLIALGGISIAALFVWYIKKDSGKKKPTSLVESNGSAVHQNGSVKKQQQNGHANGSINSSISTKQPQTADVPVQNEKPTNDEKKPEEHQDQEETDHVAAGDNSRTVEVEQKSQVEVEDEKQTETQPEQKKPEEEVVIEKAEEPKVEDVQEEQFVKKEEPKLKAAPAAPLKMPTKTKVLEHEQIPEEPTPTKCLGNLSVDIVSPASAFSWSEEMEKSFNTEDFQVNESSDFDRSPASPLRSQNHYNTHHSAQKKGGSQQKSNRKGGRPAAVGAKDYHHNNHHQQQENLHREVKKGQRRLTKEKSVEEKVEKPQKRVVIKTQEAPAPVIAEPAPQQQQVEVQNQEDGYEKVESPGLDSQNSEASSQDSGRATGPLPSPHDGEITGTEEDYLPMYEFEIPNSLVGLIIGVKGKTIKELSQRTSVRMLIRQHHATEKSKSHQICQVRGKREEINHCLQMLRRRFPPARFPELNLQPVVPPVLPNSNFDMLSTQPTWLTLPEDIKCEVAISSIISASHFFIQQPTHPSFASLRHLDMYMIQLYGEQSNLPELPVPCNGGLLCAAPVGNSWFRAVTVNYYEETDEVFVRFVDYGGYSRMARQDLRQIRTDLMSLPFQATEVMLAHVRPVDGTLNWSNEAMAKFTEVCMGKVISCKVVGHYSENQMPMVELYVPMKVGEETHEVRYDQILMQHGFARTADPSKMERKSGLIVHETARVKRPSFSSQTSQTAVVC